MAIDSHLKKIKFVQTEGDPYLCVLRDKGETLSYLAMYVDNILIASKTDKKITKIKTAIANCFEAKDMDKLHYFLGVKIIQDLKTGTIWLA